MQSLVLGCLKLKLLFLGLSFLLLLGCLAFKLLSLDLGLILLQFIGNSPLSRHLCFLLLVGELGLVIVNVVRIWHAALIVRVSAASTVVATRILATFLARMLP